MRRAHRAVHFVIWPVLLLAVLFGLGLALALRPPPENRTPAAEVRP
jgi:hypothetical protein